MGTELETKPQLDGDQVTSIGSFIWELVKILVIAIIIIVPIRLFIAEPFIVSGSSMLPNFHDREYLIINKAVYLAGSPKRGDVIVLKYPKNTKEYFIKRVIGLPGDTIKIDKGSVYITNLENPNGHQLDEKYLPAGLVTYGSPEVVTLKSGEYYVLGDNRGASSDSRFWGILPEKDIVGKAFIRVLPINKFTIFSFASPLE